jgi:hypothetical protein
MRVSGDRPECVQSKSDRVRLESSGRRVAFPRRHNAVRSKRSGQRDFGKRLWPLSTTAHIIRWSFTMADADQGLEIHVEVDEDNMIGLSFIAAGLATSVALTVEEADELMLALQQAIGAAEDDD